MDRKSLYRLYRITSNLRGMLSWLAGWWLVKGSSQGNALWMQAGFTCLGPPTTKPQAKPWTKKNQNTWPGPLWYPPRARSAWSMAYFPTTPKTEGKIGKLLRKLFFLGGGDKIILQPPPHWVDSFCPFTRHSTIETKFPSLPNGILLVSVHLLAEA